jgi:hypothetical protein
MPARDVPAAGTRYESYSHEAMAAEVAAGNDPAAASEIAGGWAGIAARLHESAGAFRAFATGSEDYWQGTGGDAVRAVVTDGDRWLARTAAVSAAIGDAVAGQAEIAARARADMPPPVPYDPAGMIRDAAASGDVLRLAGLNRAMTEAREAAEVARRKAVDVMNARDIGLRALAAHQGFAEPPSMGSR